MLKVLLCIAFLWLLSCSSCWAESENQQQLQPLRFRRQAHKLHITVLYSSLCPDSKRFAEQLGPTYRYFKDYIDIELVPFGKASSYMTGTVFFCQHGVNECEGNALQNCAIKRIAEQADQVGFVACQMAAPDYADIKECAQNIIDKNGIDDVYVCSQSHEGKMLQLEAENITKHFNPTFIPTIIYNRVFNQHLQDASIRDFGDTICMVLIQEKIIDERNTYCRF